MCQISSRSGFVQRLITIGDCFDMSLMGAGANGVTLNRESPKY